MGTNPIREDARGPYVRTGGYVFRPGAMRGYEHVLRMDAAGLVAGDRVKARHRGGTPLARIVLEDGTTTHWAEETTLETTAVTAPPDAAWLQDGRRDLRHHATFAAVNDHLPRKIEAVDGMTAIVPQDMEPAS